MVTNTSLVCFFFRHEDQAAARLNSRSRTAETAEFREKCFFFFFFFFNRVRQLLDFDVLSVGLHKLPQDDQTLPLASRLLENSPRSSYRLLENSHRSWYRLLENSHRSWYANAFSSQVSKVNPYTNTKNNNIHTNNQTRLFRPLNIILSPLQNKMLEKAYQLG